MWLSLKFKKDDQYPSEQKAQKFLKWELKVTWDNMAL